MNLFLIAHNLKHSRARSVMALRAMTHTYPLLDPRTLKCCGDERLFAAYMHTSHAAAAPRRYAVQDRQHLTLYDGCPVHPQGTFAAHDASELSRNWNELHEHLEGQFFAARLDLAEGRLELVSDPLGMHQTFYHQNGDELIVSNSVQLISDVTGLREVDTTAASLFLGMGYVGGDRTLVEGVKVFPAGERWHLGAFGGPRRSSYFSLAELAALPKAALSPQATASLAEDLGGVLRSLSQGFGALECPITAGRDSRMMVGLMMKEGLSAQFFSTGEADNPDVQAGRQIAHTFDLPHAVWGQDHDVVEAWDEASMRLLEQNDGLVTLAHIQNAVSEPARLERLSVHLYGAGGELARGELLSPRFILESHIPRRLSRERVEAHLYALLSRKRLHTPAVSEAVRAHIHDTVGDLLGQGFALSDVPCAFFLHDGMRRWCGAQFRQIVSYRDVFSPFCTRPYVRAAFGLPLALRYSEHLPFELLRWLSPELHALPFQSEWYPQTRLGIYREFLLDAPQRIALKLGVRLRTLLGVKEAVKGGRGAERQNWLERKLAEVRALCLSQPDSPLWACVDRAAFERLTAPETPVAKRRALSQSLFLAVTVLHYGLLLESQGQRGLVSQRAA